MKRKFLVSLMFLFTVAFYSFAQEEKAVIGLGEVTTSIKNDNAYSAAKKLHSLS